MAPMKSPVPLRRRDNQTYSVAALARLCGLSTREILRRMGRQEKFPVGRQREMERVLGRKAKTSLVGEKAPPIRPLLRRLEEESKHGELKDSELAPDVLATLREERKVGLAKPFDATWLITAIRVSDNYFTAIRLSAGQRDWQRDFGKTAVPILVGVAWSLERSADAQAIVLRLCDVVARRLRLRLTWPADADESNDLKNAIYRACLDAGELECDDVLVELQGLTVAGPG